MKDGTGVGSFRDDIEKWAEMWAQAQADGGFGESKPAAKSSSGGFFGLHSQSDEPAPEFSQDDFDVWDKVSGQSPSILQEVADPKLKSPNPVPAWTMGPDSGVMPGETAPFFTSDDINRLSEMKIELDRLQERIGTAAAKGQNFNVIEQKVRKLLVKIDELSNALSDYSNAD